MPVIYSSAAKKGAVSGNTRAIAQHANIGLPVTMVSRV
jgi:hypothetical protein